MLQTESKLENSFHGLFGKCEIENFCDISKIEIGSGDHGHIYVLLGV